MMHKLLGMVAVLIIVAAQSYAAGVETLYAPTPVDVVVEALKNVNLKSSDILYDLGSGDGRVPIIASKGYGCRSVGIELDESLVTLAKKNVTVNGLDDLIRIYQGDVLEVDFKQATVVYLYLMPELSQKLIPALRQLPTGTIIISHDKPIPGAKIMRQVSIKSTEDKRVHIIYYYINTMI